jgi:hypothetical protein
MWAPTEARNRILHDSRFNLLLLFRVRVVQALSVPRPDADDALYAAWSLFQSQTTQSTEFMLVRHCPLGATQFQRRELLTAACLTEISVHFIIRRSWVKRGDAGAAISAGLIRGGYVLQSRPGSSWHH